MAERGEVTIIANPTSGCGRGRRFARSLVRHLRDAGFKVWADWTGGRGHAEVLARQSVERGARTVVACGGDGTLHEVAQALAGTGVTMMPAPAGRCNDFCRALGQHRTPDEVTRTLAQGSPQALDLVKADGRYYCTVGAVGFDAEATRYVDEANLPVRGTTAYLWAALQTLRRYQPPLLHLVHDHGVYDGPMFMTAVANTPTYGNNIPIVPHARPNDGLLDICLVRPLGLARVAVLMPALMRGRHGAAAEVTFFSTTKVTLETDPPVEVWADGEPVARTPLTMEVAPGALRVMAPPATQKNDTIP